MCSNFLALLNWKLKFAREGASRYRFQKLKSGRRAYGDCFDDWRQTLGVATFFLDNVLTRQRQDHPRSSVASTRLFMWNCLDKLALRLQCARHYLTVHVV